MSLLGYLVWLTHAGNSRRDRVRTIGLLPPTTPAYEIVGHWLRHPWLTRRARSLAKADPTLGLYGSLATAHEQAQAERRRTGIAKILHRKIRAAVDPVTADIAVAVYDLDVIAGRLADQADYDALTALIAGDLTPARLTGIPAGTESPVVPAPRRRPPWWRHRSASTFRQVRAAPKPAHRATARPTVAHPFGQPVAGAASTTPCAAAPVQAGPARTVRRAAEPGQDDTGERRDDVLDHRGSQAQTEPDDATPPEQATDVEDTEPTDANTQDTDLEEPDGETNAGPVPQETAAAVAYWYHRDQALHPREIAARIGRSERTVRRYWPTLGVSGRNTDRGRHRPPRTTACGPAGRRPP